MRPDFLDSVLLWRHSCSCLNNVARNVVGENVVIVTSVLGIETMVGEAIKKVISTQLAWATCPP